jgi:hemerythrin superfamily protein
MPNANELLRKDHRKVNQLFGRFKKAETGEEKAPIVEEALHELEVHTQIEEEVYYPAVRAGMDDDDEDLMDEAEEEHHVVDVLAEEIKRLDPDDDEYSAKFTVLSENVEHHIEEEEGEMFPKAMEVLGRSKLEELGRRMAERKQELMPEIERQARSGRASASLGASSGVRMPSAASIEEASALGAGPYMSMPETPLRVRRPGTPARKKSASATRRRPSTGARGRTAAAARGDRTTAARGKSSPTRKRASSSTGRSSAARSRPGGARGRTAAAARGGRAVAARRKSASATRSRSSTSTRRSSAATKRRTSTGGTSTTRAARKTGAGSSRSAAKRPASAGRRRVAARRSR